MVTSRGLHCRPWLPISSVLLLLSPLLFLPSSALKLGQICVADKDCDAGLHCDACDASGRGRARCTLVRPLIPTSKAMGLPFNRYSWLTTHNSFAVTGEKNVLGVVPIAPTNQQDSISSQLQNGVRGFMLDMYDFLNDIWLCHSFGGQCYNVTAFQPALNVLKEMKVFLDANPNEIITIFIEDYVTSPKGLTKLFDASGLRKYWFPVSKMPKNGGDWPIIDDMISQNQRLLVFTSISSKEASEGIAYQWRYTLENQYGDEGMKAGSCPSRAESPPMNTKTISLIVQNYFPDNPDFSTSCVDNSAPLRNMVNTCYDAAGKRWTNYIAVNFYEKSDGLGASGAVDAVNGQLVCGCSKIDYCKANTTFGICYMAEEEEAGEAPAPAPTAQSPITFRPRIGGRAIPSSASFWWRPSMSLLMLLMTLTMLVAS